MSTATEVTEPGGKYPEADPVPFSRFGGSIAEFTMTLAWDTDTRRGARQQRADNMLLTVIAQRLQPTGMYDPSERLGTDALLSGLSDGDLEDIIDEVEERQAQTMWRVFGDESQPPRERLDAHLAPAQALGVERDKRRQELVALRVRQDEEAHLNRLRIGISMNKTQIESLQAEVEQMETDLAERAKQLGVPAWPEVEQG